MYLKPTYLCNCVRHTLVVWSYIIISMVVLCKLLFISTILHSRMRRQENVRKAHKRLEGDMEKARIAKQIYVSENYMCMVNQKSKKEMSRDVTFEGK